MIKTWKQNIAENLKEARFKNLLIFDIDNKSILKINIPECTASIDINRTVTPKVLIAFILWLKKDKQVEVDATNLEPFVNTVLFTNDF